VSVALDILHAKLIQLIILSFLACLTVLYFSTVLHKRQSFRNKTYDLKNVVWFSLQSLSETFLILRRIERHIIINVQYIVLHVKYPIFVSGFNETWGSNPAGGEIFRTCPDRPWGPPSLLYNGYRVFPGGKVRPGRDADPLPPSIAEVKNRVELHLYSP
jgi:hypothetical protein